MTRNTRITTIDLPFAASGEHLDYLCQVMPIVDTQLRRVVTQLSAAGIDRRYTQCELDRKLQAFMRDGAPSITVGQHHFFVSHLNTALRQSLEQALIDMAIDLYADYLMEDDYESVGQIVETLAKL